MDDQEIKKEDAKVKVTKVEEVKVPDEVKVEEVKIRIEKFSQETEDLDEHVLKALATAKRIKEGNK